MSHIDDEEQENMVRGGVLRPKLEFIKRMKGVAMYNEALRLIGMAKAKNIKDGDWYPVKHNITLISFIKDKLGEEYIRKCGKYTAENLGFLKYILRFASVKTTLERMKTNIKQLYKIIEFDFDMTPEGFIVKITEPTLQDEDYFALPWVGSIEGYYSMVKDKGYIDSYKVENGSVVIVAKKN